MRPRGGGAEGTRTHDILLAKQALYQLSYGPCGTHARRSPSGKRAAQYGRAGLADGPERGPASSL